MVLKTRKALWAVKAEAVAGTVETLTAANVVKVVSEGVNLSGLNPLLFPDNTVHSELGEHPQFAPGLMWCELPTISIALAGASTSGASDIVNLTYSDMIEACAFEALNDDTLKNDVVELTVDAGTGVLFRHGETVTAAGTGEAGVVISDTWNSGEFTLYIEDTGADFDALDTLTGAESGATCTVITGGVAARRPHAYRILSDPDNSVTLTIGLYTDGKLIRFKGCRGNMILRVDHANRPFLDFNFKGIAHTTGSAPFWHADTSFPTGVEYLDRTAPASLGLGLTIHDGTNNLTPTFNRLSLDMGNGVVLQEDTNSPSGWDAARITTRAPKLMLNPREVLDAAYPFLDNFGRGTLARTSWVIGSTAGNIFKVKIPFLQTEGLNAADRDSVLEWDGTFKCTKGSYTDASGNTAFGANNEVVLFHY